MDGLLICRSVEIQEGVREIIAKEAMDDVAFRQRLEAAATNLQKLVPSHLPGGISNLPSERSRWIGSPEHGRMKTELEQRLDRLID